jgi:ABC-type cobalamin/Fe3+-siderophores transport system ATPase subunit
MILQVMGPHGAGKTTLVRRFMERYRPAAIWDKGKIIGYEGRCPEGTFFVVGSYERVCGGCDGAGTQAELRARIKWAAERFDHVIFEGIVPSTCFGSYIKLLSEWAPGRHMFAFLTPPVEVCVSRVLERRRSIGNLKPFNPKNVIEKHRNLMSSLARAKRLAVPHVVLNWKTPQTELLKLLSSVKEAATSRRKVAPNRHPAENEVHP